MLPASAFANDLPCLLDKPIEMREAVGGIEHPSVLHAKFGREGGIAAILLKQARQPPAARFEMAVPPLPVADPVIKSAQLHRVAQAKSFHSDVRGQIGAHATHTAIRAFCQRASFGIVHNNSNGTIRECLRQEITKLHRSPANCRRHKPLVLRI